MYSVTEPNTFCSKWFENVTFSHRFPVFSTWGVAHRGLWTTSQWSPMPLPTANRSTKHPGRSKTGGRREHVNIDTTTCDPIISMSKEKISLKMRVFRQKIARIGPLTQKGLIWREFCPLTPEGRLPRLSKAVKVTAASNDCHPLKILEKGGEPILSMGFFAGVFSQKNN